MKHKRISNSLDSFVLFYKELERRKKVAKAKTTLNKVEAKPKMSFKVRLTEVRTKVADKLNSLKRTSKLPAKKTKKLTKAEKQELRDKRKRGILGIGLLLVIVSIAYSTTVVREFVDSPASLVILAPQVVFAGISLIRAFLKIYK